MYDFSFNELFFYFISNSWIILIIYFSIINFFLSLEGICNSFFLKFFIANWWHFCTFSLPFYPVNYWTSRRFSCLFAFTSFLAIAGKVGTRKSLFGWCYGFGIYSRDRKTDHINSLVDKSRFNDFYLDVRGSWIDNNTELLVEGDLEGRPLKLNFLAFDNLISIDVNSDKIFFFLYRLSSSDFSCSSVYSWFFIYLWSSYTKIKGFSTVNFIFFRV